MTDARRRLTAYHEAGHVVAAYVLGYAVRSATIEPRLLEEGGSDAGPAKQVLANLDIGRDAEPGSLDWRDPLTAPYRRQAEDQVVISLAGPEAERLAGGHDHQRGATGDLEIALSMASAVTGGDVEAEVFLAWLAERTRNLFQHPAFWPAVESLAAALIEAGTLRGSQARAVIRSAVDRFTGSRRPGPW